MKKKLTLEPSKPRNPIVAAALFKKAGSHRKSNKALRAAEKQNTSRRAARFDDRDASDCSWAHGKIRNRSERCQGNSVTMFQIKIH